MRTLWGIGAMVTSDYRILKLPLLLLKVNTTNIAWHNKRMKVRTSLLHSYSQSKSFNRNSGSDRYSNHITSMPEYGAENFQVSTNLIFIKLNRMPFISWHQQQYSTDNRFNGMLLWRAFRCVLTAGICVHFETGCTYFSSERFQCVTKMKSSPSPTTKLWKTQKYFVFVPSKMSIRSC